MSLADLADRFGRSLLFTTGLLQQLETGLKQRRLNWISAKPSEIAEPAEALDRLSQEIAAAEALQQQLLQDIAAELPPQAVLPGKSLHINATRIAAALPAVAGARLKHQAAQAIKAAKAVRVEIGLGNRLVQFSQQAHESMVQKLVRVAHPMAGGAHGYDRRARSVQGGLLSSTAPTGSLVDGRL